MYKLCEAGINNYILNIIAHYLRNRNVYIEIGENRSGSFKPELASLKEAFSLQFYLSSTLQKCSKNANVKLKSTLMTPHMFQLATRWKKLFRISKKVARKLQNGLECGVVKSQVRKQKFSSFEVSVKKSENLQTI